MGRAEGQRTFHPARQLMHSFITTPEKGKVEDATSVNAIGFLLRTSRTSKTG